MGFLVNQCESAYFEEDRREFERAIKKIKEIFPIATAYQANILTYPSDTGYLDLDLKNLIPLRIIKQRNGKSLD